MNLRNAILRIMMFALVVIFASVAQATAPVVAPPGALACYKWDNSLEHLVPPPPPCTTPCCPVVFDEVYKLDIRFHSKLSETAEEKEFGHPKQYVYSVHGKHVGTCGKKLDSAGNLEYTTRTVTGTLHATLPLGVAGGARLGLVSHNTTGCPNCCKDVEISCKSTGPGFPPQKWHCFGQNKFGREYEFDLVKVSETEDGRCCQFEDGEGGGVDDCTKIVLDPKHPDIVASGLNRESPTPP